MFRNSIYDIEWKYYDLLYGNIKEDVDFYRDIVEGDSLLELMCGTGRIITSLDKIKERYGLDIDERMLSILRSKDEDVITIMADAKEFDLGRTFDNIIIGLNSILLFDRSEKLRVLVNAYRHLNMNGKLIIDAILPPDLEEGVVYLGDYKRKGNTEIYRYFIPFFSDDMRVLHLQYIYDIFEMDGYRRETAILDLYPESYQEMREIARKAGFKVIRVYGSYTKERLNPAKSERMILVLGKGKKNE